jgi:NADH dehydrogenase
VPKTILIAGAGFAGLNAARALAGKPGLRVLLVDRRNHHLFQPLLYQVATAGLNPADIAVPIRSQFRQAGNVEVRLGRLQAVDLDRREVFVDGVPLGYDFLLLACGSRHSYFGHPEWEEHAPGLKTLEQATEIRRRLLGCFERAEMELDPAVRAVLTTFVVVGGGPTGVELAGAIADIARTVLLGDFSRVDPARTCVILAEAGPRILANFSEALSARAMKDLEALGVEVRLNARVEDLREGRITINGQPLGVGAAFWAAGVQAERLEFTGAAPAFDRAGRLKVLTDLSLPGHPEVFVAGDMASFELETGALLPGVAPAAIQAGKHAAECILARLAGRPTRAFRYRDKGQMATIGKRRAIAQAGRLALTGRAAWWAWLLLHIFYLAGFKNRISVLAQWTWSYLFSKRGARLITERSWKGP